MLLRLTTTTQSIEKQETLILTQNKKIKAYQTTNHIIQKQLLIQYQKNKLLDIIKQAHVKHDWKNSQSFAERNGLVTLAHFIFGFAAII